VKILYLPQIDSTHLYLIEGLKKGIFKPPIAIWSDYQTAGIGSKGGRWEGKRGNLFLSFALPRLSYSHLPPTSLSIYFGTLLWLTLREMGRNLILKWPNDLYLPPPTLGKVGGILTTLHRNWIGVGVGLNTTHPVPPFPAITPPVENREVLKLFLQRVEEAPRWEKIFPYFAREFEKNRKIFGIEGKLLPNGAVEKDGKIVEPNR